MHRILYSCVLFSIFLFLSSSINAETASVSSLVDHALQRSELIIAAEKTRDSAKFGTHQARAWQNPSLSFSAGGKSVSGKSGLAYDATVTQPFYYPGKLDRSADVAFVQEKIAGLGVAEARLFIRYSVIRLTYLYAVAVELSSHLEERVTRFKSIREYLASRPFLSPKTRTEKHIVGMKLTLLSKELDTLQAEKDIIWARLNLFLGMEMPPVIEAPWYEKVSPLDFGALMAKVEAGNLDLKKQALVLERTKAETSLARSLVYPDFSLSAMYREDRVPDIERFFGAGITLNVPLWNRNGSGVKSMEAAVEAENARYNISQREAKQTFLATYIEYDIARKNLERLPLSDLKDIHSFMNDADDAFYKGSIDLATYGEVESQSFEMHLAVFNAQYEYVDKYAALQILQGSEEFVFTPLDSAAR